MRPILTNLLITSFPSNSFPNSSTPPLNTPSSSPLLRPTSSPMTPITPLVLSDSTTTGNGGHYEKEDFFSHEAGYFFHNHNEELYTTSPYYYTEQSYNNNNCNTAIQPQVTVNINNPSPLSSGATTNSFNTFNPNSTPAANNYANYAYNHHQMMSSFCNDYTAPTSHFSPGMDYNQQSYDGNNNINSPNSPYNTLGNMYLNEHMQNQDAQLHEMITGLSRMDIIDSL
ncbi:uncharacterized protein OCT59_016489 [Rhizophagus irregularis]|uniref:Uncharacterized protein n=3 Tax=Rhizophagus irregularis TaxID=588596 RepID=A0A916EE36_9GLOM|nr:hypothetical protein GLOIN_2v1726068 [Rhizophagus irregularis DAOM 181602=DAOM 197198]EXX67111.1 hypothetical protein RirG_117420 [Rhizophagus irregularis DAOM 197198w]UZO24175.1 hypothetical protein OCT59_016489 [Rhizophagus irregularis]POG58982.1 hypothetical protein GLOIN_2v1726068 [Rhizophagus irregularis DAOM 181602=DAOM 197198]CAB4496258.1 unnamed protein product [Rhizophagus irregularis]CAB5380593.1 unnamed protein product [Rhizophagus irregularis]|eukprot:XP_025165848.1 hypothetical protein GLOIN_2v1726068 [Rhizophagus irregularis DAOM 181602=DAOM 197198]